MEEFKTKVDELVSRTQRTEYGTKEEMIRDAQINQDIADQLTPMIKLLQAQLKDIPENLMDLKPGEYD